MENASRNNCLRVSKDNFFEKITYTWSFVENFLKQNGRFIYLNSPSFRKPGQSNGWNMQLGFNCLEFNLVCQHKLKKCIGCDNAENVEIDIICKFIKVNNEEVISQIYNNIELIDHKFSLIDMLIKYSEILVPKIQLLHNIYRYEETFYAILNKLRVHEIKIQITIIVLPKTKKSSLKIESNNHKLVTTLVNNYESLLTSGKFSNFIIKVNDAELKVHKAVLAARSPFFSAMFESNMSENKLGYHEAKVCEENTFKNLLQFIYCSKVIIHGAGEAMNLLVAADFYELLDLKQVCEIYLLNNINDSNSLDILVFAESYNLTELNIKARDYIVENIQKMSNEVVFDVLSQKAPHSLKEIFKKITRKIK